MVYPRQCPLCGASYTLYTADPANYATVRAEPSGTPSPWLPNLPGRMLTLMCHGGRGRRPSEDDHCPARRAEADRGAPRKAGYWPSLRSNSPADSALDSDSAPPVTPVTPEVPLAPVTPVTPLMPDSVPDSDSAPPVTPVAPEVPLVPVTPVTPLTPERPESPSCPISTPPLMPSGGAP
jgi:hypothetical protein